MPAKPQHSDEALFDILDQLLITDNAVPSVRKLKNAATKVSSQRAHQAHKAWCALHNHCEAASERMTEQDHRAVEVMASRLFLNLETRFSDREHALRREFQITLVERESKIETLEDEITAANAKIDQLGELTSKLAATRESLHKAQGEIQALRSLLPDAGSALDQAA